MTRLSKAEALRLGLIKPKSKYNNNKPTYYDPDLKETLTFDSNKELSYYLLLKDRVKKGEISDLRRQYAIVIQPPFTDITGTKHRAITYKADFVYLDRLTDTERYIDVKGSKSTLTEVYKLKKKLLAYKNIIIEEVY